jgi:ligand-binding SRPBCC domain-containing protein
MGKFVASVFVDCPQEMVWRYITDFSNLMKNTPNAPKLRQVSPGSFGLGATFSGKDGRLTLEVRITEFTPERRMIAEFVKPGFLKGTTDVYSLETIDGKTRLTETWKTRLNGVFKLLGPFFAPRTKRDVTIRLNSLKHALESEQRP